MSQRNPNETAIILAGDIPWFTPANVPPGSVEQANLYGDLDVEGPYLVLMKWFPGFGSSPHHYITDRICVVLSGVWWCNSGADFDPANTEPVAAGGYVLRRARTDHYDGVPAGASAAAVVAISGLGPVRGQRVDPTVPIVRTMP